MPREFNSNITVTKTTDHDDPDHTIMMAFTNATGSIRTGRFTTKRERFTMTIDDAVELATKLMNEVARQTRTARRKAKS